MIYLIGEGLTTIHHMQSKYGLRAALKAQMSTFQRRHTSPDACAMLQAVKRECPHLVWIQRCASMQEAGRRPNVRTAIEFFSGLVACQVGLGVDVILEGKAAYVPVRDEVFAAPKRAVVRPQSVCSLARTFYLWSARNEDIVVWRTHAPLQQALASCEVHLWTAVI